MTMIFRFGSGWCPRRYCWRCLFLPLGIFGGHLGGRAGFAFWYGWSFFWYPRADSRSIDSFWHASSSKDDNSDGDCCANNNTHEDENLKLH
jgi:hypothetical protein